jgi:hypothetical protein
MKSQKHIMARNEKVIEDALFQIKNLEEALKRNAQGILSSTMKEEISSLVKESLKEQDEIDDEDVEDEMDDEDSVMMGDEDEMDLDADNEDEIDDEEEDSFMMGDEDEDDMSMDSDEDDTIDLTGASDAEVLRVFKAMGDNDGVIVKQDDNMIHLSDNENDTEYLIQLGESEMDELYGMKKHSRKPKFSFDDEEEMSFGDMSFDDEEMGFEDEFDFSKLDEMDDMEVEEEEDEVLYELEIDTNEEEDEFEESMSDTDPMSEFEEDEMSFDNEFGEGMMYESKKGFKTKGVGMGSASKYKMSKKPNMDGGFKTVKKNANKTMGTGKAKFEYKEEVNMMKGKMEKPVKKTETKEAARTYGNGSKEGRGLRKGITPNRNLTFESAQELEMLRAKNEEYRKALDLFRTKLNEVAVFNSNLAYATRLFTEHSTTKQEKINILRRFDNAETLKESKTLYKVIKDELGNEVIGEKTISESIERTVSKSPVTGSAVNLIESKTYENPQFLRMKDLMGKLK